MTRATVLGISIQPLLLWFFSKTDQVLRPPPPPDCEYFCLFFCLFFFCFVDVYVSTSNFHIHTYTHKHTCTHHIHAYQHTYTDKVLLTVYYNCHLVISSCHNSYQQYIDISLNYKKPEFY